MSTGKELEHEPSKPSKVDRDRATQFLTLLLDHTQLTLFQDEYRVGFARIKTKDGYLNYPINSGEFHHLISANLFGLIERSTPKAIIEQIAYELNSRAIHSAPTYPLEIRAATKDGTIWYDLIGKCVSVTKEGWQTLTDYPILFRNYPQMKKQIEPVKGGRIERLFEFVNIPNEDERLLLVAFIVSSLIPNIPHPILTIHGPQGSGKSSLLKYLVSIIDPSNAIHVDIERERDFYHSMSHRLFVPLDNLSGISRKASDLLCRVVTGTSYSKRKLHTDEDDITKNLRRVVAINGISVVPRNPDLLDRCILIELDRISENRRKEESEIGLEFEKALPEILGGCFDLLSKAMAIKHTIKLSEKPRMADFGVWACAVAIAYGSSQEALTQALKTNARTQNREAIESSLFAHALISLLNTEAHIQGTPTDLLRKIRALAERDKLDLRRLPNDPRSFGRQLVQIKPNLESLGYYVEQLPRDRERIYKIGISETRKNDVGDVGSSAAKTPNFDLFHETHILSDHKPPDLIDFFDPDISDMKN